MHILLFAGTLKNFSMNVTSGSNETIMTSLTKIQCYDSTLYVFYPYWDYFHTYFYAIGPFCAIVISNILIFKKLFYSSLSVTKLNRNKKRKLVITVLITSFLFIVCSLSDVIAFGYFYDGLASTYVGSVILNGCDIINFTFIAFNCLLYFITNKFFRNACIFQITRIKHRILRGIHKFYRKIKLQNLCSR